MQKPYFPDRQPRVGAHMTRVRVHNFTLSLDGYGAGPLQTREIPLGIGGEALHDWLIQRARSSGSMASPAALRASTTIWRVVSARVWVPGSWAATCSDRFVVRGWMTLGV